MDTKELKELRKKLHKTLTGPALPVEAVIDAVDILVREMQSGVYSDLLDQYDLTDYPERLSLTAKRLGRRTLQRRLEDELPSLTDTAELTRKIAANVALEDNLFIRCIPLFIKRPIINLINSLKGDNYATYTFSNLGKLDLPDGLAGKVKEADFTLGRQRGRFGSCACATVGDVTSMVFSRKIAEDSFERAFVSRIRDLGLRATVQVPFVRNDVPVQEKKIRPVLCKSYFLPSFLLSI